MPDITLKNVGYDYIDRGIGSTALDGVDLAIKDGEFVCVLGRSGCGKSTLLSLMAGLLLPTRGEIFIDGKPVTGPGTDRAVVFQSYSLFPWMSVIGNVQFGVSRAKRSLGKAECRRLAVDMLERVGMLESLDLYPYQLSGGMRQRVAIARALAMDADVLLLDEPFGALDTRLRAELQTLLEGLWQRDGERRRTVVFVTHDIDEALLLADRVIYMRPGHIEAELYIDLPRPRREHTGLEEYALLRERLTGLFYETEASGHEEL